jgi:hypothetical protein
VAHGQVNPLFVSFYTDAYAEHAAGLIESLEAFGLAYDVRRVSGGDWLDNVNFKPAFLLGMMREHQSCPLVWLDADARVRQKPVLFNTLDCDFAAHWRHGEELLSGTMYFAPTVAARRLCAEWRNACWLNPREWDQKTLQRVIAAGVRRLRVERLPSEYTRVFDDPKMGEPVVEHLQASRQLSHARP